MALPLETVLREAEQIKFYGLLKEEDKGLEGIYSPTRHYQPNFMLENCRIKLDEKDNFADPNLFYQDQKQDTTCKVLRLQKNKK